MTPTELPNSSLRKLFNKHHRSSQLTLTLASLALLLLLVGTFTLPFNQGLFSHLFNKPSSHAAMDTSNMMDMAYPCGLTNPAFCDNFSEGPAPAGQRGRGGDLDDTKWSFSRGTSNVNFGQGTIFDLPPTEAQHCKTLTFGIKPDNDSFMCGSEVPEPEHWMEAFNDNGAYEFNSARIVQPFDFTNRVGTINFGVDAKSDGGHTWWVENWITDQSMNGPHNEHPGVEGNPKNGIGFAINGSLDTPCGSLRHVIYNGDTGGLGVNEIASFDVYINYQHYSIPNSLYGKCFITAPDTTNMFSVKLSQTHIDVYVSEAGTNQLMLAASADITPALNFSVGYVSFEHAQYNSNKPGGGGPNGTEVSVSNNQTYHWHDMGFDGPIHSTPRSYEIPDPLLPHGGSLNTGYVVTNGQITGGSAATTNFTFNNVDITNATTAKLTFTASFMKTGNHINYQFNNGTWRTYTDDTPSTLANIGAQQPFVLDVPIGDLVSGTNTLQITTDAAGPYSPNQILMENIDLDVYPTDNPTPASSAPMIPCDQFDLMMTSMPNMSMVTDDTCPGFVMPSMMPSMSPMPTMSPQPASAPLVIYDNSKGQLINGWTDCSTGVTPSYVTAGKGGAGTFSIQSVFTQGQALSWCNAQGASNAGLSNLDFYIMTPSNPSTMYITIQTKEHQPVNEYLNASYIQGGDSSLLPNKWEHIVVPFSDLGIDNSTVTEVSLVSDSSSLTTFTDSLSFTNPTYATPNPSVSPSPVMSMSPQPSSTPNSSAYIIYDNSTGNLLNSWSDCSTGVYTHYTMGGMGGNGAFSLHTAMAQDRAVSMCNSAGASTSGYSGFDFYSMVQTSPTTPDINVSFTTSDSTTPVSVSIDPYILGGDNSMLVNKWEHIFIPFSSLGLANKSLTQISFVSNNPNPSYISFYDSMSFTNPGITSSPSPLPTAILGDLNGDSHVNLTDLSIFAASYGTSSPNIPDPKCDLNGDGVVNLTDLSIFSKNFGT